MDQQKAFETPTLRHRHNVYVHLHTHLHMKKFKATHTLQNTIAGAALKLCKNC